MLIKQRKRGLMLAMFEKPFLLLIGISTLAFAEKSGPQWCSRYPASPNLVNLSPTFLPKVREFINTLREADASVCVSSGFRPAQRQYLMAWSWRISMDRFWYETVAPCTNNPDPTKPGRWYPPVVPTYQGPHSGNVDITWDWRSAQLLPTSIRNCTQGCASHLTNLHEADAAARAMKVTYGLCFRPALASRHCEGKAVDMNISWDGDLVLPKKNGEVVTIKSVPRNGTNHELHLVGATYGLIKCAYDPPHWSEDSF